MRHLLHELKLNLYWLYSKYRVSRFRKKEKIKVLFVVSEVSSWKSEMLYVSMLAHPRFNPILGLSTSRIPPNAKTSLIEYVKSKHYDYSDLDERTNSIRIINPDIIFYYKPYSPCYSPGHYFNKNLRYVFCGLDYCFETTKHVVHLHNVMFDYCWQYYAENFDVATRKKMILGYKARNIKVTGIPIQDILMQSKDHFDDPWKDKTNKKRIIYAPHHSIKGTNGDGIEFSTFLEFGEAILEYAKKYKDKITIAFKPHPNLYMKLIKIWGKERTDNYYNSWSQLPNTQLETGDYIGLFKYSDAIVHDSSSFLIEYLYMDNPSMYLLSESNNFEDLLDYARGALDCYEKGQSVEDVEKFIVDILHGNDQMRNNRRRYYDEYLMPPGSGNACENIIDAILNG